jgi:putative transposase
MVLALVREGTPMLKVVHDADASSENGTAGGSAAGLSAATITRLTAQWQDDAEAITKRSLTDTDYVYVWADGIHLNVRLEADKVCLPVMIGVRAGARFEKGKLVERPDESGDDQKVA